MFPLGAVRSPNASFKLTVLGAPDIVIVFVIADCCGGLRGCSALWEAASGLSEEWASLDWLWW